MSRKREPHRRPAVQFVGADLQVCPGRRADVDVRPHSKADSFTRPVSKTTERRGTARKETSDVSRYFLAALLGAAAACPARADKPDAPPAPAWLKLADQGTVNPALKGYVLPEGVKA